MSHTAIMALPVSARSKRWESEEAALIEASRNGDEDAFEEIVRQHQQRVFRLAGRFFRRPEEVEEAAQDTFFQAWRKLHTYRAEAPFEHWLTRICLNCCYARFRKRRGDERALDFDLPTPARDLTARLEVGRLLARLDAADRFVLLLLHGEGLSVAEIADRMGWSRANVKVRAHRARQRLRSVLTEEVR